MSLGAHADISCGSPAASSYTLNIPSGNIAVSRDAPVGTFLTSFSSMTTLSTSLWKCSDNDWPTMIEPVMRVELIPSGTFADGYVAFKTNVEGVGLVMRAEGYLHSGWNGYADKIGAAWLFLGGHYIGDNGTYTFGARAEFALVKTGPIAGGKVQLTGVVAKAAMRGSYTKTIVREVNILASGGPTFVSRGCSSSDVNVNLGEHGTSSFSGVGSRSTATDFQIDLTGCSSGMAGIQYRIDPAPGIDAIDSGRGIAGLSTASSAQGVGVQVTKPDESLVPFGTPLGASGYDASKGGQLSIPLRAAYVMLSPSVRGGQADSQMVFTLDYL